MACQFDKRIPELIENLTTHYSTATKEDIISGTEWYPRARRIVEEWSKHYQQSRGTVACVIAALSPQNEWSRNLIQADDILARRPVSIGGIHTNIVKAQRILSDRAESTLPYFPSGPKVASFALNLAGNTQVVTVDTHAIQAALNDVASTYTLKWGPYMCFATAYQTAAGKVGLPPSTFQAIIWHMWKRLNPPADKRNARRQWDTMGEY